MLVFGVLSNPPFNSAPGRFKPRSLPADLVIQVALPDLLSVHDGLLPQNINPLSFPLNFALDLFEELRRGQMSLSISRCALLALPDEIKIDIFNELDVPSMLGCMTVGIIIFSTRSGPHFFLTT